MGNQLHNLVIYNGYPLAVVAAVLLHCALLVSLLMLQRADSAQELELVQPTIIKSLFIDENPQVVRRQELERQRLQRLDEQRRAREQEQLRQQREAEAAAEAERQRQAREQDARERAALLERQQLERQQRLEREQQLERERSERAAEERRREEQRLEQQRQEAQRQREEQAQRETEAAAEAARTEFELVQSATALIQQAVQATWSRPPSARNGMRAVLRIAMLPTGEVTDVTIIESSNDPAFDRSAENAVYRAAPFTELQSLPIRVFNQNFRSLSLIFQPEDLLN